MRTNNPDRSIQRLNDSSRPVTSSNPSRHANQPFNYEQEQKRDQLLDTRRGGKNPSSQHEYIEPVAAARDRSSFLQAAWSRSVSPKRCVPVHVGPRRKVNSRSQTGNSGCLAIHGEKRGFEFGVTDEHTVVGKAKQFSYGFAWAGMLS